MRKRHEEPKGVICERCNTLEFKPKFKRISTLEGISSDSTGRYRTIDRVNLCSRCYEEYKKNMLIFF